MARGALPRLGRAGGAGGGGARSRRGRVGRRLERRVVVAFVEVDELRQVLGLARPMRPSSSSAARISSTVADMGTTYASRSRSYLRGAAGRGARARSVRAAAGPVAEVRVPRDRRAVRERLRGEEADVWLPHRSRTARSESRRPVGASVVRARARVRHHVATTIRVRNRTRRPSVGARRRRGARSSSRRGLAFDKKRVARSTAPASRASAWDPRHVPCPSLHVMIQRRARARTAADK